MGKSNSWQINHKHLARGEATATFVILFPQFFSFMAKHQKFNYHFFLRTVHIKNYLEDKKLFQSMLVSEIVVVVCTSSSVSSVSSVSIVVVVMFSCAYR